MLRCAVSDIYIYIVYLYICRYIYTFVGKKYKNDLVASINVLARSNARCYLVRHALVRCEVERVQRAVSSQHCRRFLFLVFDR